MTGGEPLWCERKFERGYNFQPTHKLWLSGNHEPVITDTTNSIWGRLKKIPFVIEIPENERKKGYAEHLANEHAEAILAWLVRGCVEWRQAGDLGEPKVVKRAIDEYRDQQDILHDFLIERCLFKKSENIEQAKLYKAYKSWGEDSDIYVISRRKFDNRIREKGGIVDRGRGNKATWKGVRLLTDDEIVNLVNPVNDFTQSSSCEVILRKTLHKTVTQVNQINPTTGIRLRVENDPIDISDKTSGISCLTDNSDRVFHKVLYENNSEIVYGESSQVLSELSENASNDDIPDYPDQPCGACGCDGFWLTDWGKWLCWRCRPKPGGD